MSDKNQPKEKKKICVNCKHGGNQFKLGGMTHLHCEHPKHNKAAKKGTLSPYDTVMEFCDTCKYFEQKI